MKGRVGINTDTPQQALHVSGNAVITGDILKPSDRRIKENITSVESAKQLRNIEKLKIYDYDLKAWTNKSPKRERGVIAQELAEAIPEAVSTLSAVTTEDGTTIHNLLVVNERVLLFENVGATQELSKIIKEEAGIVDNLDSRVEKLESVSDETVGILGEIIDYILNEEYHVDADEGQCLYFSVAGLGPAWTLFVLGFFIPILWLPGVLYLFSSKWIRRYAGAGNLICTALFTGIILLMTMLGRSSMMLFVWVGCWLLGIISVSVLGYYVRKRWKRRTHKRLQLRASLEKLKPSREYVVSPKLYSYQQNLRHKRRAKQTSES